MNGAPLRVIREETDRSDERTMKELGQAVRTRRRQLGITLNAVSQLSGLSVPFLSQIENANASPSLTALFNLARALETTPERLLAGPVSAEVVITAQDDGHRYAVTDSVEHAFRRQLTGLSEPFSAAEYVVQPKADLGGFFASAGREIIYVTRGRLAVDLQEDDGSSVTHELGPGDSIVYSTAVLHRWRHRGRSTTRFIHLSVSA